MASTWPPAKEADLVNYVGLFSAKISASPTTYGLVAADATGFATSTTTLTNAYHLAIDPATKTRSTVAAKDVAKASTLVLLRSLAKRIQANPAVTAAEKSDLGLPIHSATPSPIPAPATRPVLTLASIGQRVQTIRISDETTPDKKARPFGVNGAEVFAYLGDGTPPSDLRQWVFIGLATKNQYDIQWTSADDGKRPALAARWFNDKGETGPLSFPITAPIAA